MKWPWTTTPDPKAQLQQEALEASERLLATLQGVLEDSNRSSAPPLTDPALSEAVGDMRERLQEHDRGMAQLRDEYERLRIAVSEGIEHESRREKRIQATVRRAQKKLEDHDLFDPALDSEGGELRGTDERGSEGGALPTVPEEVDEDGSHAPSSIPGVTLAQLQRIRGV